MSLINQAQIIFEQALTLNPNEIDTYVKRQCGLNHELMDTVLSLLKSHDEVSEITLKSIQSCIVELLQTNKNSTDLAIDENPISIKFRSNRYQMIKKIGFGGMSSVYLCQRDHNDFKQNVAIKVIETLNDDALSDRFKQEKQILAQLEHPNIAQFIDTDYLADGTPFVTMEYVSGIPITQYSEQHQSNIHQKLNLFSQLCTAVQYAHQNLIIHRDIKPNNILVTDDGEVKLLDFGIAKIISEVQLQDTQTGNHMMTPAYASPEQILKKPLNISTDIYSLGVVLYELLTGSRPFNAENLTAGEYEKLILNGTPELPSKNHNDNVNNKSLKGDLDAIALKCIEGNPKSRYQTVTELLSDIKRYQSDLPVGAQKPTFLYKGKKFIKRNLWAMGMTVTFFMLTSFFIHRIYTEKQLAQIEQQRAELISESFIQAFKYADPTLTLGENIKAKDILDQAAGIIQNRSENNPKLFSNLNLTMAQVYYNTGLFPKALESLQVIQNSIEHLSESQIVELELLRAKIDIKNGDFDQALNNITKLPLIEEFEIEIKTIHSNILIQQGKLDEAGKITSEISMNTNSQNPNYLIVCTAHSQYLRQSGKYAEQQIFLEKCLENSTDVSELDLWQLSQITSELAESFKGMEWKDRNSPHLVEESNRYFLKTIELRKAIFGENHISMIDAYKGLGWNEMRYEKFAESINYQQKALTISEKYFGENHPNTSNAIYNLAHVYINQGDALTGTEMYKKAIQIMLDNKLNDAVKLAFYYKSLSYQQQDVGQLKEAEFNAEKSIEIFKNKQGNYIYRAAEMKVLLTSIYVKQGRLDDARKLLAQALPLMYTMHKKGDHYRELGEKLDVELNGAK